MLLLNARPRRHAQLERQETGRRIDLSGIVDPSVDSAVPAGRELIGLARRSCHGTVDRAALDAVADAIGSAAAIDAAAIAANFQIMNRVVDATGLPIGRHRRQENSELIAVLGLERFPHASH